MNEIPPNGSVLSFARAFVDQQQFIFDMLWHKAVPPKQRIKEIEQGLKREFIETIQDPYETQKNFSNILKSANEEILITLPLPFLFQIVLQEYPNIF
jgi:hypothetical protein